MAVYNKPKLLDFKSSPPHLQFNKYVWTGYRPVSTYMGCLRSLFYMHNEFGNIYTHGVPFVCFLVLLPLCLPWAEVDAWWMCVVHYLACLSPTAGSLLYHVFMNHEGGVRIYDVLLSLDVFGVWLVNTLGALPIVHITLLCQPPPRRRVAMVAYLLLSCLGVRSALTARSSVHRLLSFALPALFRFFLFLLRWIGRGTGSPSSLSLYVTMESLAVLGGLVNVSRVPERFGPGRFDYWLNSHQIMHVIVVMSILYLHWGTLEDLVWLRGFQCPTE
ncbi:progestin and adipoQ receptor family member 4 [Brachyhypopomus gauderio]|uniref:progestin and adipoQ receptor family member 4 n=1 Tax=Brachyhypopomus gauderio TaxID=698409 RepID=UPI0040429EEA